MPQYIFKSDQLDELKAAKIPDRFTLILCHNINDTSLNPNVTAVIIIFEYKIEDSPQIKELFAYIASRKSRISFISIHLFLFCAPDIDDDTLIVTLQNRFYVGFYYSISFENCFIDTINEFMARMLHHKKFAYIANPPIMFCHSPLHGEKSNELYKEMKEVYDTNAQKCLLLTRMFFHASS